MKYIFPQYLDIKKFVLMTLLVANPIRLFLRVNFTSESF